jgi:hypothetical protein
MRVKYITGILIIALIGTIMSCKRGRPDRKTLPDFLNSDFESDQPSSSGLNEAPIYVSDTVCYSAGARQKMFNIVLPDPDADSIVWNIIQAFEPIESSVEALMQTQNKAGVVLDFREPGGSKVNREEFSLELAGTKDKRKYQVVFLWDDQSQSRAEQFLQNAANEPGIRCIAGNESNSGLFDCFDRPKTSLQ